MRHFRVNLVRKWFTGRPPVDYSGKLTVYDNGVIMGTLTTDSPDVIYRKTYITGYKNRIMQFRITKDGDIYYNSVPAIYTLYATTREKSRDLTIASTSISRLTWKVVEPDLIAEDRIGKFPDEGIADLHLKSVPEVKMVSEAKRIINALEQNPKVMMKLFGVNKETYNNLLAKLNQ